MPIYLCYDIKWDLDGATRAERKRMTQITIASYPLNEEEESYEEGVGYVLADKLSNETEWCVRDLNFVKVATDDEERFIEQWHRTSSDNG